MVGLYRVAPLGFALAGGAHVLSAADFAAVEGADALVRAAEGRAAEIVSAAEAAYADEKARGFAEGRYEGRLQVLGLLLEDVAELERGLAAIEADLSRLVAAAVRKMIEGFDDHARIEAVVRGALGRMRRERRAELHVPPHLAGHLRDAVGRIVAEFPDIEAVEIVEDPDLVADHIALQTAVGRVDVDVGERLAELESVIRSAHAKISADRLDALTARGFT